MKTIKNRLKELEPYVISIRFTKGLTVVDTLFKTGWVVPNSDSVGHEVIKEKPNYYMLYPVGEDTGLDEMLDYVEYVITVNVERELKSQLLHEKINELKQIFSQESLKRCEGLEFTFGNGIIEMDDSADNLLSELPIIASKTPPKKTKESKTKEDNLDITEGVNKPIVTAKVGNETFDLPPKKGEKIILEEYNEPDIVCKCDPNNPNEVCPICIDEKM